MATPGRRQLGDELAPVKVVNYLFSAATAAATVSLERALDAVALMREVNREADLMEQLTQIDARLRAALLLLKDIDG